MKTVSVKIQIPDNMELACDEVRAAQPGEYYVDHNGKVSWRDIDTATHNKYPIVREAWKPPGFLKPGWIAMDGDEVWYWYDSEPKFSYEGKGRWWTHGYKLCLSYLNFTPPACSDPKQSKRRIE